LTLTLVHQYVKVSDELIAAARWLAQPELDSAILAEGNVSQTDGEGRFWVKASGHQLGSIDSTGFVLVDGNPILAQLDSNLADREVKDALRQATIAGGPAVPSVETFMHAWLLTLPGVECALHAHPVPQVVLSSHPMAAKICQHRLFPDEIVCCGPATVWVPYVDPGLPLAQAIRREVTTYVEQWSDFPRAILLGNHGLITLGGNLPQAKSAFQMAVKSGRAWVQALSLGWPETLSEESIQRIAGRPDEHYRQRLLWAAAS
jgi:rhamnose utilization protein RhaD (predicted bifunctional aldolase and dehydrogenase)